MDIKKKIYFSHENIFSLLEIVLKRFCYEYGFQPINSFRRNSAQMHDFVAALDNVIWKKNCQKKKKPFYLKLDAMRRLSDRETATRFPSYCHGRRIRGKKYKFVPRRTRSVCRGKVRGRK